MFDLLRDFIQEVSERFKIISLEIKIHFTDLSDEEKCKKYYISVINQFIKQAYDILSKLTYSFISFNFYNIDVYDTITPIKNSYIIDEFKSLIRYSELQNCAFSNHISYVLNNTKTNLEDNYDYYDYVYYDKLLVEKISKQMNILKKNKHTRRLYQRKIILKNIIGFTNDLKKIYKEGRLNYSSELLKNQKIVPLEVSRNNILIFKN